MTTDKFILLLGTILWSQMTGAQTLPLRVYSVESGLSEAVVNDIVQDKKGFIWAATEYGLNRLDGRKVKTFYMEDGLAHNKLNALFVDTKNRLWVGTDAGVSLLYKNRVDTTKKFEMLATSAVISIYQDSEGNYWFGTDGEGVWLFDIQQRWTHYTRVNGLANNRVRSIKEDKNGVIWFGTRNGLTSLKDGNFRTYTTQHGLADNKIREIYIDDESTLWISTRGGVSILQDGAFKNLTSKNGLINNRVQSVKKGSKGEWIIGTEEGISIYQNGQFTNFDAEHGLTNRYVVKVFSDNQQGIWLGTFGGGLNYLPPFEIRNFTRDEGLPNNMISAIIEDSAGRTVVGTFGGGIAIFKDNNIIETLDESRGLVNDKVYTLYRDDRGRILIGTRWGLSIYENGTFTNYNTGDLPERKIRTIHQSGPNTYWLGTLGNGMMKMEGDTFTTFTREDGLSNNTIRDVVEDAKGVLWIATYGGVNRYKDGSFTILNMDDGLPNNGVNDIEIDRRGDFWFATFSGFVHYRNGAMQTYGVEQGMPDEVCYFIEEDKDGVFWIGTNKGLVRFDYHKIREAGRAVVDTSSVFRTYTVDQGLVSNELNTQAIHIDEDGFLWAGTVGGLSRIALDETSGEPEPSPLYITDVKQLGSSLEPSMLKQLPSWQNYITIEFIGLDFIAPRQVLYEYRLKGSGTGWRRITENRVQYTALSPGSYTFEVRARNFYNQWSRSTESINFTVMAPFWQRWWFYTSALILFLASLGFIYHYYRINKAIEMERLRVRIASDLHDDVGASLTEIALQTDLLKASGVNGNLKDVLDEIGAQSRQIVTSLEDIVWTIDARNDTLGDLTDRVQDYANKVLGSRDIDIHYEFDEADMDCTMQISERENLYLILKEALNNIAKHSDADTVWMALRYDKDGFALQIKDNGSTGVNTSKKTGHGLMNMKMRSDALGACFSIDQQNGFAIFVTKNSGKTS